MQPAYYEDFIEIKKKIWLMLDDAVKNRASQFRIPTFICGNDNNIDGRTGHYTVDAHIDFARYIGEEVKICLG